MSSGVARWCLYYTEPETVGGVCLLHPPPTSHSAISVAGTEQLLRERRTSDDACLSGCAAGMQNTGERRIIMYTSSCPSRPSW